MQAKPWILLGASAMVLAGCHTDMWTQPKTTTYKENDLFEDGKSARPLEKGVVARGLLKTDTTRFKGRDANGEFVNDLPGTLTIWGKKVDSKADLKVVLMHGQERFDVFCSHCHGKNGDGDGMITQRGLALRRPPASYHTDRLRKMPNGYFYDVITNGHGTMYSQAPRVPVDDRWAIVSYIRALQFAHTQSKDSLTQEEAGMIDQKPAAPEAKKAGGGH
jgi:mono/diheme cytochrome c family protein